MYPVQCSMCTWKECVFLLHLDRMFYIYLLSASSLMCCLKLMFPYWFSVWIMYQGCPTCSPWATCFPGLLWMGPNTKPYIYLKQYEIFLWLRVAMYLMCGSIQLFFFLCGPERPKGYHWVIDRSRLLRSLTIIMCYQFLLLCLLIFALYILVLLNLCISFTNVIFSCWIGSLYRYVMPLFTFYYNLCFKSLFCLI